MKLRKTLALAAAGGMLLLPPLAYDPAGEQAPAETRVSVDHSPFRLHTLPFSVGQVLDYFNEAFGKRPFKIDHKSFVYTDRENPDEVGIITVSDFAASPFSFLKKRGVAEAAQGSSAHTERWKVTSRSAVSPR
jgi:hypothetical protein